MSHVDGDGCAELFETIGDVIEDAPVSGLGLAIMLLLIAAFIWWHFYN